ncbi:YitT family protein [Bacillus nakamurai]|uniref:YitT family protein n=1 Tax=Bacillus nakamurai TaxID=1793963 RepID=A0A150F3V9_9BACI|nr:YitT family protein [Bacillus nakamurai]KXZ15655.1 hypothetical protein AXI58_02705 [Bacillus nakamurai]MED1229171.1 YitT family protein [Bacillus nakamurai]
MKRELVLRWTFYFAGLLILSFGVSLTIKGKALGISPWDAFHYGLFQHFGLSVGQWSIVVGAAIVALTCLFTKTLPKLGAILNMVLLGMFIDFFSFLLPEPGAFITSAIFFSLGLFMIGCGVGIYVSAGLGAGPRDSLMMLISEKTGWNVQWVRNGIELTILGAAWAMGGPIGIGTIITAILTGLILRFSLPQSAKLLTYAISGRAPSVH